MHLPWGRPLRVSYGNAELILSVRGREVISNESGEKLLSEVERSLPLRVRRPVPLENK